MNDLFGYHQVKDKGTYQEKAKIADQSPLLSSQDLQHRLAEAERRRNSITESDSLLGDRDPAALLTESKSLRNTLKQQEEETSTLRSRVRHLQQLLDERTGALTLAHSSAAAKAEAIQEKYRHLVEGLEARLEHKETQLQQLVESLAMRDQVLVQSLGAEAATAEHLCKQLEEKEQQLGALFDAKSSVSTELAAARRELARRSEAEKQASRKSLQTAQRECERLQQELVTAEDAVHRLQDEVQTAREAKRVAEDQSRRQVEERDALIRKLQATISDQEKQVSSLTKEKVGASSALASFEAMVMEKTARLEESLALREKALEDALHEYRCLASAFAEKEAEVDRVREDGAATAADLKAMIDNLERQVEVSAAILTGFFLFCCRNMAGIKPPCIAWYTSTLTMPVIHLLLYFYRTQNSSSVIFAKCCIAAKNLTSIVWNGPQCCWKPVTGPSIACWSTAAACPRPTEKVPLTMPTTARSGSTISLLHQALNRALLLKCRFLLYIQKWLACVACSRKRKN